MPRNRNYTKEDVRFIHNHFGEMTRAEMAEARGLTLFQVNKIITELRKNGIKLRRMRKTAVEQYVEELGITPRRFRRRRKGVGSKAQVLS